VSEKPEDPHIEYPFDHAVINVRDALDEAVTIFTRLGFRVTPRGFHTLGSINHLIVFGTTYIELIGFPTASASVRAELSAAKTGLNGLVFRTQNAQVSGAQARARGAPVGDAQQFSRPVDLRDEADAATSGHLNHDSKRWPDAVFRTARAEPGFGPGGRLYFCEHLTPELVWREPWRAHPNAALELSRVRIESNDLPKTARQFSELLGARSVRRDGATALISAAPVLIEVRDGAREFMRGVQIKVSSLARTRAYLSQRAVPFTEQPAKANSRALLRVAAEQAGAVEFEFSEA
jgi:Glyoxalase-like domain